MIFNSITFFMFFTIVLCLYFVLPHRIQNRMLLVASYIFYGWWDWRFLFLIFILTFASYFIGILIYKTQELKIKKRFLIINIIINFGLLGFFKYFNFFTENFIALFSIFGANYNTISLNILLPVGISFYTFQTMTYSIGIYRNELQPTNDFLDYALFVAFFPQLLAGPIGRAKDLLPQIKSKRDFKKNQMLRGLHLIFWGLFKKVFIADNLAIIVNNIYGNPASTGTEYVFAAWVYAFQIYGDFSGYTDMARGIAKCFGIELMHNFKQPYFALNPSDFWRRWHISLSSWFRDYLYISLGGNRKGKIRTYLNLFLTMLLCGLWHGSSWNFVIWGAYHGLLLSIHRLFSDYKRTKVSNEHNLFPYFVKAFFMFQFTCLGWIFFRAESLDQIKLIISQIFSSLPNILILLDLLSGILIYICIVILVMFLQILFELRPSWFLDNRPLKYLKLSNMAMPARAVAYGVLTYLLCFYGAKAQSFIYFNF